MTEEKKSAMMRLCVILKPGSLIYTLTEHKRVEGAYVRAFAVHNGEIVEITRLAHFACGFTWSKKSGRLSLKGGGYSFGFEVAYELGLILCSDGYAFKHTHL